MVPGPAGPPSLTEKQYWRDYDIIRNDVNAAIVACYTHRTINHIAATDLEILERMNRAPDFWRVTSFSLQSTLFIVLARILDNDDNVHSVCKVLNATTAHPEFFSRDALRARKLSFPGADPNPLYLDEYVQNAWVPTVQDLCKLKRALAPHKTKFDAIYKPIRNQIAQIVLKDEALVTDLYSKTLKTDIDEILCFLQPDPVNLASGFQCHGAQSKRRQLWLAGRVREITKDTERIIRQLP